MAFGENYVFPGGVVDPADRLAHARCSKLTSRQADLFLGLEDSGLDFYSAAVRELFEETGVLLACASANGHEPVAGGLRAVAELRDALNAGHVSWQALLSRHDLWIDCDRLHYFAHWVTPRSEPKRYSTRFFLAAMPERQSASHDGGELTDSRWMSAGDVLHAHESGDMRLIHPTYATLRDIAGYSSVGDIVRWARHKLLRGVPRVRPAIVDMNGSKKVVFSDDPAYPVDDER